MIARLAAAGAMALCLAAGSTRAQSPQPSTPAEARAMLREKLDAESAGAYSILRTPPSGAELDRLAEAFAAKGGDPRWLQGMASGQYGGLDWSARCDNAIKWVESIHGLDKGLVVRVLTMD